MYFHKTPFLLKMLYPDLVWDIKTADEKIIYLTFDDGPVEGVTEFVLDILNKWNAKATFFCVGDNVEKNSGILKKMKQEGHTIGNHTQHHYNGWNTNDAIYFKDVERCNEVLDHLLGKERKKLFRPPYGRIKRSQIKELKKEHDIIMWDVLSGDFDPKLDINKCLQKSIQYSNIGSIIIFHDSYKAENTLRKVLPLFLEYFSELNYKFRPL